MDVDVVRYAKATGTVDGKIAEYLLSSLHPLDRKAAVISALGVAPAGGPRTNALMSRLMSAKRLELGAPSFEQLSGADLFCLGYLMVMDGGEQAEKAVDLFDLARAKLPASFTAAALAALARAQLPARDTAPSQAPQLAKSALSGTGLRRDMRPRGVDLLMEHFELLGREQTGSTAEQLPRTATADRGEDPQVPDRVIEASRTAALLAAIGPNRVLKLAKGTYALNHAANSTQAQEAHAENSHAQWLGNPSQQELVISGVCNLTLVGEPGTTLVGSATQDHVLTFRDCRNIELRQLTLSRTAYRAGKGGILRFERCINVNVVDLVLIGVGTGGLTVTDSSNLRAANCVIQRCGRHLMVVQGSRNLLFEECEFKDAVPRGTVTILGSSLVTFSRSMLSGNRALGQALFTISADCHSIAMENSTVVRNQAATFVNRGDAMRLTGNEYHANVFNEH